ncbi:Cell wall integrity and stress response component 1 [Schistosoma japonicum]|nr:Cell wall integrity and stress response component 1 [Schistosoma japonicum]
MIEKFDRRVHLYSMAREEEELDLVVIGAGLGRTGTNSLKIALELLYKKPCYHLKEIYLHQHSHIAKWIELDKKLKESPDKIDKALCHKIFKGYIAAIDHPACAYYKELLELYPKSKVVLTVRDPEIWLAGCRSTILPRDIDKPRTWSFQFLRKCIGLSQFHELFLINCRRVFGEQMDFSNDTSMLNGFVEWNQNVIQSVPSDRLLKFDISQGWEPLCKFLQLPIPDCPFPHVNEYNELRRLLKLEQRILKLSQWLLPTLILFIFAYMFYKFVL